MEIIDLIEQRLPCIHCHRIMESHIKGEGLQCPVMGSIDMFEPDVNSFDYMIYEAIIQLSARIEYLEENL